MIFVVFLFGVAVDYSIFLASSRIDLFRTGVDRTLESQSSVLLCTLTTCGGFGSLVLAGHPVMHSIGVTALAGLVSSAVATQLFVPVMIRALLHQAGPNGTPRTANILGGAWAMAVLGGGGLWFLLFRRRGGTELSRRTQAIGAIRGMCGRLVRTMICGKRQSRDLDRLTDKPCIMVANHESMFDLVTTLALPRPIRVLVKDWVWKMPVMGNIVRAAGYIRAGTDPETVFAEVSAAIADGHSVLVFPEGKRSRDGKIGRFHNGAFAMARRLGVEVQPLAMVNTRGVVPYRAWWVGDHHAVMAGLEPMDPADFPGDAGISYPDNGADREMARACRQRIRTRVTELWPSTQNGPTWFHLLGGMYRYFGPLISHYAVWKCRLDPLIRELPALCPGEGRILVAGGGFGLMTARLALACPGREIISVDLDERKLSYARAALGTNYPVQYVESDIRDLPSGEFDLVLAVDILHYWDDKTQRDLLQTLSDRVAPGKRLIFREGCTDGRRRPSMVALFEQLAVRSGFTQNHGKLKFRSEDEWRRLLEQSGLTIESSHPELGQEANLVLVCRRGGIAQ